MLLGATTVFKMVTKHEIEGIPLRAHQTGNRIAHPWLPTERLYIYNLNLKKQTNRQEETSEVPTIQTIEAVSKQTKRNQLSE